MKHFIILFLCLTAVKMSLASELGDSITIVRPDSVSICQSDKDLTVSVYGNNGDSNYTLNKSITTADESLVVTKEKRTELDFSLPIFSSDEDDDKSELELELGASLLLGVNTAMNAPKDMSLSSSSYEVWVPDFLSFQYNPHHSRLSYSMDWGFDWRNYRMTDNHRFLVADDGAVSIGNYPEGASPKFSRIKVISGTWTFLMKYHFGSIGHIKFGPVISMNGKSSMLTRYTDNGKKVKEKTTDLKVTPLTVDWVASVTLGKIGFYAKYCPNKVFREDWGPKFSNFTVGVNLFW